MNDLVVRLIHGGWTFNRHPESPAEIVYALAALPHHCLWMDNHGECSIIEVHSWVHVGFVDAAASKTLVAAGYLVSTGGYRRYKLADELSDELALVRVQAQLGANNA